MISQYRTGQGIASDGVPDEGRLTRHKAIAVTDGHARFYDAVQRGNVFMCAQQAAAALGTGLTATAVTLTLYNPSTSPVHLVMMQTTLVVPVATTAGFVTYAVNDDASAAIPATVTALTVRNAKLGSNKTGYAKVYSAATLPAAPVAVRHIAGIISTTPGGVHTIVDNVDGAIQLMPNTAVTIQGITTNATGVISLLWEEVSP